VHAPEKTTPQQPAIEPKYRSRSWLITAVVVAVAVLFTAFLWFNLQRKNVPTVESEEHEQHQDGVITLDPDSFSRVGITIRPVSRSLQLTELTIPAVAEPNQQQMQQVTPLVSGRVERINAAIGDYVRAGSVIVVIDSPQVAEMHGKLHEAETRIQLAKQNLNRVKQSANRVSILKAKASLEESEANLKRVKQLVQEGLAPQKDLVAAEAEHERAKAEYNFQKDITLNRELAQAQAELKTAETEAEHIKDGLRALDAHLPQEELKREHEISRIQLTAPISGTVIERFVNPGAGFEAGKPLLTIANTDILWVIANVPDKQLPFIRLGMPATVKAGTNSIPARVSYIDPRLNEDTRTGRVRLEIQNPQQRMKVGSYVQAVFNVPGPVTSALSVPAEAVQNVEGKTVVFVQTKPGSFEAKTVTVGPQSNGSVPIFSGLSGNEQIVATGAFVLKSQMLKEQFGDHH
jgi:membrane fusion protein, heavy metal efflux system